MKIDRRGVSSVALAAALACAVVAAPAAAQDVFVVPAGTTDTAPKQVNGTDTLTVEATGTLEVAANPAVDWNNASAGVVIDNYGIIRSTTGSGRAINASGANNARSLTLNNRAGALIESNDDAFRINVAPTSGIILVNNWGTIRSNTAGQALDFNAVTGGATVLINNMAGGTIESNGNDAIRPGQGAVVTNAGLIRSAGPANQSWDGIDFQDKSGTVFNVAGGTISGLRHGITSDVDVNVTNFGDIIGRNGSGVGSDGTGTVLNEGLIQGNWDGVATNGDGDGVDIDGIGLVRNFGTIEGLGAAGVDSGGRPNSGQGIAMGGGEIENDGTGTIYGAAQGVLINFDGNPDQAAFGATLLTNRGSIAGGTAEGVIFHGNWDDSIVNSGSITGGNGFALNMGAGNDTLIVREGSSFGGVVDGGAGTDTVRLQADAGINAFTDSTGFESLIADYGTWRLTGTQQYSNGITISSLGQIFGSANVLSGNTIANSGSLVFEQPTNATFTGSITGAGRIDKLGAGNLTMGAQTFTGVLSIGQGNVTLTGNLATGLIGTESGATLTSALAATVSTTATNVSILNRGTINTTNATGRAINLAGGSNVRAIELTNFGVIQSADDAFRINANLAAGSTVLVNNYGLIRTTSAGQALDFDAIANTGVSITINNYAGGFLRSQGQDAIRPGEGAVVNNWGTILSDGAINNSFDGVDWQQRAGTVNNMAGGSISGLRHGITSDINVTVNNAGTITGRNGSGIGSDGVGTVFNSGTITGRWDGFATNGDGDGVDIDGIGSVTNLGTIEGLTATGVDSGGRPNSAQGVAMGGGTVDNRAGATILGGAEGVLINFDGNPGGAAFGATTILNAGTIRGQSGAGIVFVGDFADTVTTSGLIAGGGGTALDLGGGADTLNITTAATFTGTLNGGAGSDVINLGGTGSASLGATVNFERLNIVGGTWTLSAPSTFSTGMFVASGSGLTGNSSTLTGNITNSGTLTFNQTSDGSFSGSLSGNGALVKAGAGSLSIAGPGFTGPTTVNAGRLVLTGNLGGSVTVNSGGTLAGNGITGPVTVNNGGFIAPGNSIGTITVAGPFAQASGSTYIAETTAAGASDRIVVWGTATIAAGAQLQIVRDGGTYIPGTRYNVLSTTGGVTGTYTLVQTPTGGIEFRIFQNAISISVDAARTAASLAGVAQTPNQQAVAPALAALGVGNPAYAAITLIPDDATVRYGFDQLSGEGHASARLAAVLDAQSIQDAVGARSATPQEGSGVWIQMLGRESEAKGGAGVAGIEFHGWGGVGGVDFALGENMRVGIAGGYTRSNLDVVPRWSTGRVESTHVAAYAGGTVNDVTLRAGAGYAFVTNDLDRAVSFSGFSGIFSSDYKANVIHGFAEIGYKLPVLGEGSIEPFAGISAYRIDVDGVTESGGAAALTVGEGKETYAFSTLGLRAHTPILEHISANGRVAWQHALGENGTSALMRFNGGTQGFTVAGANLSEDAALYGLEVVWTPAERIAITSGYSGSIGGHGHDNRFRLGVSVGF